MDPSTRRAAPCVRSNKGEAHSRLLLKGGERGARLDGVVNRGRRGVTRRRQLEVAAAGPPPLVIACQQSLRDHSDGGADESRSRSEQRSRRACSNRVRRFSERTAPRRLCGLLPAAGAQRTPFVAYPCRARSEGCRGANRPSRVFSTRGHFLCARLAGAGEGASRARDRLDGCALTLVTLSRLAIVALVSPASRAPASAQLQSAGPGWGRFGVAGRSRCCLGAKWRSAPACSFSPPPLAWSAGRPPTASVTGRS